jgi:putative cell wall-binding protein
MTLFNHVFKLFNQARIEAILSENNPAMEATTLQMANRMSAHLNLEGCLFMADHFKKMLKNHPLEVKAWEKLLTKKKQEQRMEQLKIPLVLVLTMLICFLIFLLGK